MGCEEFEQRQVPECHRREQGELRQCPVVEQPRFRTLPMALEQIQRLWPCAHSGRYTGGLPAAECQQKDWASLAAQWLIQVVSKKAVALQNVATGKWLNVEGGGLDDGVNVWQWNSDLQNHSWFTLEAPHCRPESAECNPWADSPECCMEGAGNKAMSCDIQPQAGWGYCKDTSK